VYDVACVTIREEEMRKEKKGGGKSKRERGRRGERGEGDGPPFIEPEHASSCPILVLQDSGLGSACVFFLTML
jgi:hypothetical protein